MAIIISGGAGFIGINFAKEIIKNDSDVHIIDNFSNGSKEYIELFKLESCVSVYSCNIADQENCFSTIENILKKISSKPKLWHFAANSDIQAGNSNPIIDLNNTFLTTFNLLESCKKYNIKDFYFASSSAVYGDHGLSSLKESTGPLMPISNYGAMKLASEAQCFASFESFLEELRIFRFPNVVGIPATHGILIDFVNKLKKDPEKLIVLGNGSQQKSYLHVSDLIKGMIYLSSTNIKKEVNPIFNLGPKNDYVKVSWIAEQVVKKISPKAKIIYGKENRGWIGDIPKFKYDTAKSKSLGWEPSSNSKEAILRAIDEIYSNLNIF